MSPSKALVCFAVREEAKYFSALAALRPRAEILVTGMGRRNAEAAFAPRLTNSPPALVLTCGFAGALNPALQVGEVVYSADDPKLSAALAKAGAKPARFHCADRVAVTAEEKRHLYDSTRADAVEMESQVIRELCRKSQIPSATVRVISDAAGEDLPLDFNQLMTEQFTLSFPRLIWALVRRPSRVGGLLSLQRHTQAAAKALSQTLAQLLGGESFRSS